MHFVSTHVYMQVWVEAYLRWLLQHSAVLSPSLKKSPGLGRDICSFSIVLCHPHLRS